MAYKATYHEDSDADDEYERSAFSPTLPARFDASPTDSDVTSAEHTPTTFTHSHSGGSHGSPTGLITQWTAEQCADFVVGLGFRQYADAIVDEGIDGEALVALQHSELKEMGMDSLGHRLTVLKNVYETKVRQNVPIDPDHYVPPSAGVDAQDAIATQEDIARIIRSIQLREERILAAEADLRMMKEDLNRVAEENKKLREDFLPVIRMAKDKSQPLPTPDVHAAEHHTLLPSPAPPPEKTGSSLSRKFSTKKLFLGSTPKNPSPTIHEGRTLTDSSSLDPSAAAMAASSHLTASLSGGSQASPNQPSQHSPTSPAYNTQPSASASRSFPRNEPSSSRSNYNHDENHHSTYSNNSAWSNASTIVDRERSNPTPVPPTTTSSRRRDVPSTAEDPPNSAGATSSTRRDRERERERGGGERGMDNTVEIFKSFRVSVEDPCYKVLPVALKKYNITADWREYALYIVHGDQERCLGLQERPLTLFKQLDREGRKPMFMLRKHAPPAEGHSNTIAGGGVGMMATGVGTGGVGTGGRGLLPGGVL
ncbi:hypothetical protein LTR04_003340 [Oleoguttula sp. CCFEE 6159]|nr:hypothetical protein LTR04_003340 [Oleoguttula sp. CCFEE 6159]